MRRCLLYAFAAAALAVSAASGQESGGGEVKAACGAGKAFIGHKTSHKVHRAECRWGQKISESNRIYFDSFEEALTQGYTPCKVCKPEGTARLEAAPGPPASASPAPGEYPFVGHRGSRKVHLSSCTWARRMSPRNRVYFKTFDEAVKAGYIPCRTCKPDQSAAVRAPRAGPGEKPAAAAREGEYVASRKGKSFHRPDCMWAGRISPHNLVRYRTRESAIAAGKRPCRVCNP